jgi:hypothetical protein
VARFLREPLVHFLALGALIFLIFNWRGGGAAGGDRIVITPGQVDSMLAGFLRTWQRPPSDEELKGLLDDWVCQPTLPSRQLGTVRVAVEDRKERDDRRGDRGRRLRFAGDHQTKEQRRESNPELNAAGCRRDR